MRYRAALTGLFLGLAASFWSIAPARSATCVAGKPVIRRTSARDLNCDCFAKTPARTKIYAVDGYEVEPTEGSGGRSFSIYAIVWCDAAHLVLRSGREGDHVFPLANTSITLSTVREQAVYPGARPPADLAHDIATGHAHLIRTM